MTPTFSINQTSIPKQSPIIPLSRSPNIQSLMNNEKNITSAHSIRKSNAMKINKLLSNTSAISIKNNSNAGFSNSHGYNNEDLSGVIRVSRREKNISLLNYFVGSGKGVFSENKVKAPGKYPLSNNEEDYLNPATVNAEQDIKLEMNMLVNSKQESQKRRLKSSPQSKVRSHDESPREGINSHERVDSEFLRRYDERDREVVNLIGVPQYFISNSLIKPRRKKEEEGFREKDSPSFVAGIRRKVRGTRNMKRLTGFNSGETHNEESIGKRIKMFAHKPKTKEGGLNLVLSRVENISKNQADDKFQFMRNRFVNRRRTRNLVQSISKGSSKQDLQDNKEGNESEKDHDHLSFGKRGPSIRSIANIPSLREIPEAIEEKFTKERKSFMELKRAESRNIKFNFETSNKDSYKKRFSISKGDRNSEIGKRKKLFFLGGNIYRKSLSKANNSSSHEVSITKKERNLEYSPKDEPNSSRKGGLNSPRTKKPIKKKSLTKRTKLALSSPRMIKGKQNKQFRMESCSSSPQEQNRDGRMFKLSSRPLSKLKKSSSHRIPKISNPYDLFKNDMREKGEELKDRNIIKILLNKNE